MVHANVLLYQITRFEQYLDEARLVAHNSLEHFAERQVDGVRIFPDSPWFNAVMFRGYLALADVIGDTTCFDALLRCLDYGWDHARDRDGLLGPDRSGRSKMDQGYRALLDEAAVVEMYALAARREATAAALAGGAAGPETSAAGVLGNLAAVAGSGGICRRRGDGRRRPERSAAPHSALGRRACFAQGHGRLVPARRGGPASMGELCLRAATTAGRPAGRARTSRPPT
jgi:hypothetical protein